MKKIFLVLSLIVSFNSFALEDQSFYHKAYCVNDEQGRESKITNIVKESEDEQTVSFRMTFTHGLCDSIELVRGPIKFQKRMLQVTNYGLSHPFMKNHVRIESFKPLSETELEARISLNKAALMNKNSRRYILEFWAGDWLGFPFVMTFKNQEGGVQINFEGFERL